MARWQIKTRGSLGWTRAIRTLPPTNAAVHSHNSPAEKALAALPKAKDLNLKVLREGPANAKPPRFSCPICGVFTEHKSMATPSNQKRRQALPQLGLTAKLVSPNAALSNAQIRARLDQT